MKAMRSNKRQATMLSGVLVGSGIAVLFSLLISFIIAAMLNSETIGESSIRISSCGITVLALAIGTLTARKIYTQKSAIVTITVGGIYFLLLLICNLLFFDGDLQGILPQIISILGGSLIGLLSAFRKKKNFKRKRMPVSR